jgi:hypothetical protein
VNLPTSPHVRRREVVDDSLAVTGPVGVHGSHRRRVGEHGLLDELVRLIEKGLDEIEALHVEGVRRIGIDGVRHATDVHRLDVGGLGAEDGHHLVDLPLVVQGLQVVGRRQQVHFRRKLHRRVPPVAAAVDAELAGIDESGQAVLGTLNLLARVALPVLDLVGQLDRLAHIGADGADDVDPVEGAEMIEVDDVVMGRVGAHHEVADVLRVLGDLHPQGIFNRTH